jgi:transcriptional regulator with XRE-family HTH domain
VTKDPWKKLLGASIRKHRMKSGYTQVQAARYYGCSLRWWQQLETGTNISVRTLFQVAKVLLVKPWLLLRW